MSEPAKAPDQPVPQYTRAEAWVFQAWLVMALAVLCCALAIYLMSFLPL